MFNLRSIVALLPFALSAAASPVKRQDTSSPCANFGTAGFDVASGFTLAAYNTTGTNTNTTGLPLVLGQAGVSTGQEYHVLSTWASYPYEDTTFSLVNGALLPNIGEDGQPDGVDGIAIAGEALSWATGIDLPAPAQIYCGVADTDPAGGGTGFPWLAVNGDLNSFSLCWNGVGDRAQENIIYQPTADNYGEYLYDTCFPVVIQIIGLD